MAEVSYKQDMAPKGGYPKIEYARNLPKRGPSGLVIMLGGLAVMAGGFVVIGRTNRQRRWGGVQYPKKLTAMCMHCS